MKKISIFASALLVSAGSFAQSTWSLDKTHTKLSYAVSHMMLSESAGDFKKYEVKVTTKTPDDFADAVVEVTIDVNSISSDNTDRDNHLKTADFFDVAKFPTITFKSKSFKKGEGKKYVVVGDLTMHGVTKPATLDVTMIGTGVNPYSKKAMAGFKFTTVLKRTDFTLGSVPAAVVGEEITISGSMELARD